MTFRATYFLQSCPTCSRKLRVRVDYLGKSVECQHCHALFAARDPAQPLEPGTTDFNVMETAERLLAQAEQLLASAERRWAQ